MLDNTKNTSDLLSPELKKRIKYLVEHNAKEDSGWEVVQDEIFMCYYPALSEKEKLYAERFLVLYGVLNSVMLLGMKWS